MNRTLTSQEQAVTVAAIRALQNYGHAPGFEPDQSELPAPDLDQLAQDLNTARRVDLTELIGAPVYAVLVHGSRAVVQTENGDAVAIVEGARAHVVTISQAIEQGAKAEQLLSQLIEYILRDADSAPEALIETLQEHDDPGAQGHDAEGCPICEARALFGRNFSHS